MVVSDCVEDEIRRFSIEIFSQSLLSKVNRIKDQINGFEEMRRKKSDRPEPQKSVPKILLAGRLSMYGSEKQMKKRKFNGRSKSKVRGIHNKVRQSAVGRLDFSCAALTLTLPISLGANSFNTN